MIEIQDVEKFAETNKSDLAKFGFTPKQFASIYQRAPAGERAKLPISSRQRAAIAKFSEDGSRELVQEALPYLQQFADGSLNVDSVQSILSELLRAIKAEIGETDFAENQDEPLASRQDTPGRRFPSPQLRDDFVSHSEGGKTLAQFLAAGLTRDDFAFAQRHGL